jgi:hypothetical protein
MGAARRPLLEMPAGLGLRRSSRLIHAAVMLRLPARVLFMTSFPLLAAGCFEDIPPMGGTTNGSQTESGEGDGDGDGDPTGDGDGDPGDGDGDPGDGDGDADPGPQVIASYPEPGDQNAGLDPYFLLFFDRVVDDGDATGNVFVSQAGEAPVPVVIMPCPNFDPACLAGLYPMNLLDADGRLPADTAHQIIVTAGFEDTDGVATTVDQVIDYKTFVYEANFFDDASALPEVGGLSYDPDSASLFVVGVHSVEFDGPRLRKIPMAGGNPQPASTVLEIVPTGGGPWTYGLDRYGDQLFISMSYAGEVRSYNSLDTNMPTPVDIWSATTLPEPNADVEEVWSVARGQDGRVYFAWGDFHGGVNGTGIMQEMGGVWSIFNDGKDAWDVSVDGVMITVGLVAGTEVLIASAGDKLYKFRTSDGQLLAEYVVEQDWARDLEIDGQGRLWYGTQNYGVTVFDISGNDEIVEVAKRGGVTCGRMALREAPPFVHAYCVGYRNEAIISHLPIEF